MSVNIPELPGYVPDGEAGCGIYAIGSTHQLEKVVQDYFQEVAAKRISFQKYLIGRPIIESLFLVGSIGTLAQTEKSDFDFWVCIDRRAVPPQAVEQLRRKSEDVRRWCESNFGMEVHFFISDLEEVRRNDFGRVDEESTGSSQKRFLKEECYRTLLLVAGKTPLWWVLPAGTGSQDYQGAANRLQEDGAYELDDLLDLGYIDGVSRDEFLGAALWQLSKGTKDPFKALLKMATMERYLSPEFEGPLLAEVVKAKVLNGVQELRDMDPYVLMVEALLNHCDSAERREDRELMKRAFYLKTDPGITRMKLKRAPKEEKVGVWRELMERWDWPLELAEELNRMEDWSYARHLKFSKEINEFFFSTYRRLSNILKSEKHQAISALDLHVLGRKMFVLFAKREHKLQATPFLNNRASTLERCAFRFSPESAGKHRWFLYDNTGYRYEKSDDRVLIFSSQRLAEAAAWIVLNGLYDFRATAVEMPFNTSSVSVNELMDLLKHIQAFFPAPSLHSESQALQKEDDKHYQMMVAVDMEEPQRSETPSSVDLIYRNNWGEMFAESHPFQPGLVRIGKILREAPPKDAQDLLSRLRVHVPGSLHETELKKRVSRVIFRALLT